MSVSAFSTSCSSSPAQLKSTTIVWLTSVGMEVADPNSRAARKIVQLNETKTQGK